MPVSGTVPDSSNRPKREIFKVTPGMYYIYVLDVDEAEVRDEEKAAKYGKSWFWKFFVVDANMKIVFMKEGKADDGSPLPHVFTQFTPDRLGINPNTKQPAKARMFLQALTRVEELPKGANAQDLVNKALENGVAHAFITTDPRNSEYMTIGSMLPVDDETSERVKAVLQQYLPTEGDEVPF